MSASDARPPSSAPRLGRIDRVFTAWWFGDALLLGIAASVLLMAALITPSDDVLTLFGREIPVVCTWRNLFGFGCPGCGLTRSFTFMAHGAFIEAFRMNLMGPVLFTVLASQVPWRLWRLIRRSRGERSA